jgi:SWI/SNF-related matrix-associated actin-dependent regulator of chromatin subfamily A-like protein 1
MERKNVMSKNETQHRVVDFDEEEGRFRLSLRFNQEVIDDLKDCFSYEHREWNPQSKTWLLAADVIEDLPDFAERNSFDFMFDFEDVLKMIEDGECKEPPLIRVRANLSEIAVRFSKHASEFQNTLDAFRSSVDSSLRKWRPEAGCWIMPLTLEGTKAILDFCEGRDAEIDEEISFVADAEEDEDPDIQLPTTMSGELYDFQKEGVLYAARKARAFIADEMGTGKTAQALAVLEARNAYPAVIVCPAIAKNVWLQHCKEWLPHRSVAVLSGRNSDMEEADVLITNYAVVADKVTALREVGIIAVVADESQYIKNKSAKRTQACMDLADGVKTRIALTGSPLLNRPGELVAQLEFLDQMKSFGRWRSFLEQFSRKKEPGARSNALLEDLGALLKSRCMIRRMKSDVLRELPEKTDVDLEISLRLGEEYYSAENYFLDTLDGPGVGDTAALGALAKLRRMLGEAKINQACGWIQDFLESTGRASLVVFAHHRTVQSALVRRFGALALAGGMKDADRTEVVRAFQAGENRVIVCSLKGASTAITLTRASHVLFVERDWTPATHAQATDRCHRIGQEQPVTSYYLTVVGSFDEDMRSILKRKKAVIDGVLNEAAMKGSDASLAVAAMAKRLGRPVPIRQVRKAS